MRTRTLRGALLPGLVLAGCGLLAACGVNGVGGVGGAANGTSSTPNANGSLVGTPGTVQRSSTSLGTTTPTASSASTASPGAVRLVLNQTANVAGSSMTVRIENGLSTKIAVTDHHTDCTYVELQQLVHGSWQPVGLCKGLSPTRLVELAPGSVTTQRITIPAGAGTYRVMLKYNTSTVFSSTFSVS
jgi:hypothetical protein